MSKVTTEPYLWLPSSADGIQLAPSSSAWTYGNWVELTSSAPSDLFAAYLAVLPNNGASMAPTSAQIQIGTGSGGAEVVVGTFRVRFFADQWAPASTFPLGLIHDRIASGTRVALRIAHETASDTDAYRTALGYYSSLGGTTGYSTGLQTASPIDSATVNVAGTTAWAAGAYSDLIAASAIATPIFLLGFVVANYVTNGVVEIAVGATPDLVCSVPYDATAANGVGYVRFPNPIRVAANARVAMRQRANTSDPFFGTVWYVPAA